MLRAYVWMRRHGPLLLVAAAVAWIVIVIVWITVSPVADNPMY